MNRLFLIPAILAFVAAAFGTVSIVLVFEAARAARRRKDVMRRLHTGFEDLGKPTDALFRGQRAVPGSLELAASRLPRLKDAGLIMQQAGVEWSVQTFLMLTVGSATAFGLAALMLSGNLLLATGVAVAGALVPDLIIRRKKRKRLRKFEEQFPDAIDLLGRAIRAGHPLSSGIRMVADDAPEPVAGEFRQVFEEQRFGLPFEDALLAMSDRNVIVDVRIFVTAVLIQREVGGNLAEILDKIAQTVRERFAILRQLRTYTAQGRMSGYVLAAMPIVMAIALFFLNREYVMLLYTEPLGRVLVVMAVVMQIIGYLWIRKIVDIEI
jgi:tight adherence protein B